MKSVIEKRLTATLDVPLKKLQIVHCEGTCGEECDMKQKNSNTLFFVAVTVQC